MKQIYLKFCLTGLSLLFPCLLLAQGNLLDALEAEQSLQDTAQFTEATFKATRLINGQSVELRREGELILLIAHRFGRINGGAYEFFGLDEANMRLGLEYAVRDFLTLGIGRSSFEKTYDGFVKFRLLRQQQGRNAMPVTVTGFASLAINSLRNENPERSIPFAGRLDYTYQLLIARKFSNTFSLQLSPGMVYRNLVATAATDNNLYLLGIGGRLKLSRWVSLNAEYFYRINASEEPAYYDPIAIGVDIETGGHVFQLQFTNAQAMVEEGFLTETTGNFFSGDIHFGFNISRTFQLK